MSEKLYEKKARKFVQRSYALCPEDHLHPLLIDVPKDIPLFCNVVWPAESLHYEVVCQHTVFVSQLRVIRVKNCPITCLDEKLMEGLIIKHAYMMKVKVHDIMFFGLIATDSDGDYISENLYNLIKTRQHPFVFRETDQDLPKYRNSTGEAMKLSRLIVLPFNVETTRKTIVLHHEILVVKSDSNCPCIFGIPFLKKIGVRYSPILNKDKIQIGNDDDNFIHLWGHKDDEQREWAVSIYRA